MGGKNGVLVLDDAGPRKAAQVVAAGAFRLTGQACTATSRVYVTPGVREAFLAALTDEAAAYSAGDGLDARSCMGAVVSGQQFAQNQAAVPCAVERGATLLAGASILDEMHDGGTDRPLFFPAAVLTEQGKSALDFFTWGKTVYTGV
ncbi:hypothetical protein ASG92_22680 [Arthrobacter sp. Soil736]|nr:hypothetical protein ASG92_22680 [Arthrobacter sp. Soil736]